jgi:hypothetical protein
VGFCGKNKQRVKTEIEGTIVEQVSDFKYLNILISDESDVNIELERYSKINGTIARNFGNCMAVDTISRTAAGT